MLKALYEQIVSRMESSLQRAPDARNEIILEMAKLGLNCFEGKEPVCWVGFNFPLEIPLALGYAHFYPEIVPAQLAGAELGSKFVEIAERKFSNMFCCSFHRTSFAAAIEEVWPKPTAIVGVSNVCDGQIKLLRLLGERLGIEPLILDVPSEVDETTVDYVELQLREIIAGLEKLSGRRVDKKKFEETIRISNQARQGLMGMNKLRKQVPCPFHGARSLNAIDISWNQVWATPRLPQLLERLIQETELRSRSSPDVEEKLRLLSLVTHPTYKTEIFNWLEKEMGAIIVMNELSNVYWDELSEQNPVRSLAHKIINHPHCGTIEKRVYWTCKLAQDYQVDGVIHWSHWGCRQTTGGVGILREKLSEIGIPLLNIDLDLVDSRSYSPGQIKTRLQSFVEMLTEKRVGKI